MPGSRDPTAKTVVFEDSAAVVGIVLAMVGVTLDHVTGAHVFDAAASIAIGALLAVVAFALGRDVKGLLIGEAARPNERERLAEVLERHDGVDEVVDLLTMAIGPNALLVAARLDLTDGLSSDDVEELAGQIERDMREAVPEVREVFLDPTSRDERDAERGVAARP